MIIMNLTKATLGIILLIVNCFLYNATRATTATDLKKFNISGYAQGTSYHIVYYAPYAKVIQRQTDSLLAGLDRSVSLYNSASLICRFNRSAKGIEIDEPFRVLIKRSLEINHTTNGLVDITVKPLVDAWGFGTLKINAFPDSAKVKETLQNVGSDKIWLAGNFLHKKNRNVQIDLNGIAQGYTADLLGTFLQRHGINNYLVEIGGELKLKGHKPDGKPFNIGIEAIDDNDFAPGPLRRVITPLYGAVTTSGNYRRHLIAGGKIISHIINPKTGYPVQNSMISVTVWAKDGITADGYDNGFMAMGLSKTLQFLSHKLNMGAYIVYKKADGSIADTATAGFPKY